MKAARYIFILLIFILHGKVQAQCPELPEKYEWNTAEDYANDKDLVKKTLRWLCNTPLGVEVQKRSVANAFVLEWLAGTPELTMNVDTRVLPFETDHPELLYTFMHGMALYMLEHPKETDQIKLHTQGLKVVAELALSSKELSKSRSLKRLLRADRKNKLREYTKELLEEKKTP